MPTKLKSPTTTSPGRNALAWVSRRLPTHEPPTHPGEMLLEEFLKPLGLRQTEAAQRLGISANRLNEVVLGKRRITADTALRLSRMLNTSPQFWMRLQADWDLRQATKPDRAVTPRAGSPAAQP